MKKLLCFALILILCLCTIGCGQGKKIENETIDKAAELVAGKWKGVYDESPFLVGDDRHLEIKNTRIVHIKDTGMEELKDVDYVIDFLLFTNYTGTAPYYTAADFYNTVTVYKDGTMDCDFDVFATYTGEYGNDFKNLIESVEDYGDEFNRELTVQK